MQMHGECYNPLSQKAESLIAWAVGEELLNWHLQIASVLEM